VEVADAVGAVVGPGVPLGATGKGPARAAGGTDAERPELVERENTVSEVVQDVLDAVELGIALGVR
jgi:hypothetical protein